ncbi:hypothetical protein [Vaginisenegalia massiliensis]|uniref:hypothetical protein n=1 Tax=Vaginisenegalia massiliensis TaxID=2058294 RepID=UPI000F52B5E2|nr:hypothetical protein [Vaginisenegalia massiliensis]
MPHNKDVEPTMFLLSTDITYYPENQVSVEGLDGIFINLEDGGFWYNFGTFRFFYKDLEYQFNKTGYIEYLTNEDQFREPIKAFQKDKWQKRMLAEYHKLTDKIIKEHFVTPKVNLQVLYNIYFKIWLTCKFI